MRKKLSPGVTMFLWRSKKRAVRRAQETPYFPCRVSCQRRSKASACLLYLVYCLRRCPTAAAYSAVSAAADVSLLPIVAVPA